MININLSLSLFKISFMYLTLIRGEKREGGLLSEKEPNNKQKNNNNKNRVFS